MECTAKINLVNKTTIQTQDSEAFGVLGEISTTLCLMSDKIDSKLPSSGFELTTVIIKVSQIVTRVDYFATVSIET